MFVLGFLSKSESGDVFCGVFLAESLEVISLQFQPCARCRGSHWIRS